MADTIAGRYTLGAVLGVGGMARVVEGHDLRLDRPVAIKVVPVDGIDPVGRERFRREARSSAGFAHPNVVATYDAGEGDGYLYIVMELVAGPSLATELAARGRLDVDEARRVADALLAALEAAHRSGIVHRDVKPGNVLLGPGGEVKLADFGIASRLDELASTLTAAGTVVGTPTYLAPEQAAGDRPTAASDIYAAGVVVYEMLAGEPPFSGPTAASIAIAHQVAPVPDLVDARPDVPADLAAAVRRAMAKHPAERFASAAEMRAALSAVRTSEPTAVYDTALATAPLPARTVAATGTTPRRGRWWWPAATAALLTVAAVTYVVGRQDRREDGATDAVATSGTVTVATITPPVTTPAVTTVPITTSTPQSQGPPVTVAATTPGTIDELVAALTATPGLYGERSESLREQLEDVDGPGRSSSQRARKLLDRAAEWVAAGQLDASVLPVLDAVIGPLAAPAS